MCIRICNKNFEVKIFKNTMDYIYMYILAYANPTHLYGDDAGCPPSGSAI